MSDSNELVLSMLAELKDDFREHRDETKIEVAALRKDVNALQNVINHGKGAVKVLAWIGSVVAGIITVIYMVVGTLNELRHPH